MIVAVFIIIYYSDDNFPSPKKLANSFTSVKHSADRRNRLHEIVIALINKQDKLALIEDTDDLTLSKNREITESKNWISRNRSILNHYQALVRSAVTMDALIDSECNE